MLNARWDTAVMLFLWCGEGCIYNTSLQGCVRTQPGSSTNCGQSPSVTRFEESSTRQPHYPTRAVSTSLRHPLSSTSCQVPKDRLMNSPKPHRLPRRKLIIHNFVICFVYFHRYYISQLPSHWNNHHILHMSRIFRLSHP